MSISYVRNVLTLALAGTFLVLACQKSDKDASAHANAVSFPIEELSKVAQADSQLVTWRATHGAGVTKAAFLIRLALKPFDPDQGIVYCSGAFVSQEGSNASELLNRIAATGGMDYEGPSAQRVDTLPFTAALIGTGLSRAKKGMVAGSFQTEPPGNWIASKVFVADGEGEFYMNLNSVKGKGEIEITEPRFAPATVKVLAKVL